jgi:hypothetical protein
MAQTAAQKKAAEQAANKKLLASAQALLEKQKGRLTVLEKQEADAAKIKSDFEAESKIRADEKVAKIAEDKKIEDARLAGFAMKGSNVFQMLNGILYFSGVPFSGAEGGKQYLNGLVTKTIPNEDSAKIAADKAAADKAAAEAEAKRIADELEAAKPVLAIDTFRKTIALYYGDAESIKPWVDALYKTASGFRKTGSTADESMNLALAASREDPVMKPFTDRFSAIFKLQDLKTSGVSVDVPTIGEFVRSQSALGDIFRRSNLGELATDAYTSELLGKGIAVSTVAENIAKVFDVIDQAPKEVKDTISRYYPTADRGKLAKALLTGTKGIAELDKEIKGYQVLAAAETQGIGANTLTGGITAEQALNYAAGGQTFQSSLAGFSQVAQARETEQKLATLSGRKSMGVAGLADAVIGKKASAMTDLERLTSEEENRYKGRTSGILASQTRGMI